MPNELFLDDYEFDSEKENQECDVDSLFVDYFEFPVMIENPSNFRAADL